MENEILLCRLCLKKLTNIEIVNIYLDNNDLAEKIEKCTKIQIKQNDVLSKVICLNCNDLINKFNDFINVCLQSQEEYQNKLNELKNEQTVEYNNKSEIIIKCHSHTLGENFEKLNQNEQLVDFQPDLRKNDKNPPKPIEVDGTIKNIIGTNIYKCEICHKGFDSFFAYYDHQYTHDGNFVFKCDKCTKIFCKRNDLLIHQTKHKITCNICKQEILTKSMKAHQILHTERFRCKDCGIRHCSKASLENHIQTQHNNIKDFLCHICGKQTTCKSLLNRHLHYHESERPFQCTFCEFSAKSKNILRVHSLRKHSGKKTVCKICSKVFKSELSLLQHTKRIHSEKKFSCIICSKSFFEKYNLTKHFKICTNRRFYECKLCSKEFFTVRNLKEHMHSHKKCVSCINCGKEFFYKKYLEKHVEKCL